MLGTRYSGAALAKVRGRGLDWGWIVVLLRLFFFRELLFYCAVARFQCRDGVSQQHDGDCHGVCPSLRVGEALVLSLGMWSECFAHTRGVAGAVLGGLRAAGRR